VDADGRDPPLLTLGAGQHGAADHHPQVADRQLARLVADELDAVGGRQDLERGDQAAAAVLALEVVGPERLGEQGRLELVLAVGDGRAAHDLGGDPTRGSRQAVGPDLIGSRLPAASAAGPPARAIISARTATTMNRTRLRMRPLIG
jgi:hypothetical protein